MPIDRCGNDCPNGCDNPSTCKHSIHDVEISGRVVYRPTEKCPLIIDYIKEREDIIDEAQIKLHNIRAKMREFNIKS